MNIMDVIHEICVTHSIRYYIIGGTALGAKRHGGFIPWDIDIDIAMPRKDYEMFAMICEQELPKKYRYLNFRNTKSYTRPHALVCIKNTSSKNQSSRYNPNEMDFGIYLDVFPLDKVPEDSFLQEKLQKKIKSIKMLRYYKISRKYSSDRVKSFLKNILSHLIFWTDIDGLNEKFDTVCKMYEQEDTNLICSMASHYSFKKQLMPFDVYGTPKLVKFDDREYFAPEKLEEYLTRIYGDYMKLPSEDEQQASMAYFASIDYNIKVSE